MTTGPTPPTVPEHHHAIQEQVGVCRVYLANGTSLCQAAGDGEETESLVMVR